VFDRSSLVVRQPTNAQELEPAEYAEEHRETPSLCAFLCETLCPLRL
jgi:hypothetical protein